jgi:hypothetical protein
VPFLFQLPTQTALPLKGLHWGSSQLWRKPMSRQSPFESVYHVRIFDESGAQLDINNLTRDELSDFNESHETDDLNYSVTADRPRPVRVRGYA